MNEEVESYIRYVREHWPEIRGLFYPQGLPPLVSKSFRGGFRGGGRRLVG